MFSLVEIVIALVVVVVLVLFGIVAANYKKSGPQAALIVYGSALGAKGVNKDSQGNKLKVVRGSGTFVLPIFQNARFLSLQSAAIDIKTEKVLSKDKIPVTVEATAMIKVGSTLQDIATAAEQFLGKKDEQRDGMADQVLRGHLRAIVGTMTVSELIEDRNKFSVEVQEQAGTDLSKMGLSIVSFVINDIRDEQNYIKALGAKEVARVQKEAAIAVANADKETRIQKAVADQDAQKAEAEAATQVANAQKEKAINLAAYEQEQAIATADAKAKADQAKAAADQAYAIQEAISKKQTTEAEMQVEIIKKQRETDLETQEVLRKAQENEANVVKAAEAAKAAQIAKAEADAREREVKALAEAAAIEATGKAEAEAIRLKGLAEAEAIEKKAEAMQKMNDAAKLNMALEVLPKVVASVSENLKAVDSINIYGGDGSSKILGMSQESLKQGLDVLGTMGIDVPDLLNHFSGNKSEKIAHE
ncbi:MULTISPECIES: flotillin family protein [unclassified Lactococcus]|uniref:flotillin family protein n=1 Tax=unclassified Lactococcus TaxID=2643510 RepID=UPI0011CC78EE|nr:MULTISPECIES: flotillin family protein [unclassified Lactococcus]MQW22551.1 flotillin family protein [Lactococcus sp. dk101]TXK45574.1 flotillin family protein [Lactococcus sp. dk310]TXK51424.1 flotillin family protein [Lactococcus sp. dk322]